LNPNPSKEKPMKQRNFDHRPSTPRSRSRVAAASTLNPQPSTLSTARVAALCAALTLPAVMAFGASAPPAPIPAAERVYVVRTGHPARRTLAQSIKKTGGLFSPAVVEVSAKITARLLTLELEDGTRVEEGTHVKRGQLIAMLESRDYVAQMHAAEAARKSAQATLADKRREWDRAEMLFKEGSATEQDRDRALADRDRAAAAVEQAQAQVEIAQINLDETRLAAPMDGVVSARHAEPGTLLAAGAKIVTITQIDKLRFQVNVPTTLYAQLALNETGIDIEVDAYPGAPVKATLSRIYPVAESETRTVRIETLVANPDGRYLPGMFATGTLALNERKDVLVVPFEAVIRNIDRYLVYCVRDGAAHAVAVEIGIRADDVVEIAGGLTEADEIVVVGQHRLADGVRVRAEKQD
jgi:RND family efflux transporter MFP subunit